ncbi:MAG: MBL fold metallo-hydrolase [Chloroflexi bacterium]|nr:MBL fold metallo-hydrolase [Chloroflexota bacterium]
MTLEITWLGHSCFRIRSGDLVILTDPYSASLGLDLGSPSARIVTISHSHPHHSAGERVADNPKVLRGPGEYEVAGVYIRGFKTTLRAEAGEGGRNTAYALDLEGLTVCHLGDLGAVLAPAQVERLGSVHILLVPAGGTCTISPAEVMETVSLLAPRAVIPMHYRLPGLRLPLQPVDALLKEMGVREATPQARYTVTRNSLPEELRLVLLESACNLPPVPLSP